MQLPAKQKQKNNSASKDQECEKEAGKKYDNDQGIVEDNKVSLDLLLPLENTYIHKEGRKQGRRRVMDGTS